MIVPLHQLARPFRIEQVGKALRRVLLFYQVGVVGDRRDQYPRRDVQGVRVVVLRLEMLGDLLRQVWCEPAVALPYDAMRLIRGVDHVDDVDVAAVFLGDAREDALGAGALDAHGDTGKLLLERLAQPLRKRQVHGGVEGELALFLRGVDQRGRDRRCFRRCRAQRGSKNGRRQRACGLKHVAPGETMLGHGFLPIPVGHRVVTPRTACCSVP
jgi:hypothetical protein